jgi:diguanylate cyclase (GGDEF)-like protein
LVKDWAELYEADAVAPVRPAPRSVIMVVDGADVVTSVSATAEEVLALVPHEVVGHPVVDLFHRRYAAELLDRLAGLRDDRAAATVGTYWLDLPDRTDVLAEVFADGACPLAEAGTDLVVVLTDVTGADLANWRQLAEGDDGGGVLEVAVTRWSVGLELEYHSPEFEPLVHAAPEDLLARPLVGLCGFPEGAGRLWEQALRHVVATATPMEFDWETDDHRWMHAQAAPAWGADGFITHAVVVTYDVAEQRRRHALVAEAALVDSLTGLPNRATAMAHITRSLGRRGRTSTSEALVYFDLDRFKAINDSLGHAIGDEVLVTVGKRLKGVLRPADVVARVGDDEFVVFFEQMPGIEQVLQVVDRMRGAISEPLTIADREVHVRASIGVAFATRNDKATDVVARAEAAVTKAKSGGRDRVEMFDERLRRQAEQRLRNELALRRAMKNGQMEVHFLPEFDLVTRRCVGAEALLRWHHPERGLVPAAEFIALAEESGLLVTLGNEVLRRACELVVGWTRSHPLEQFSLRVNLSARQLAQATLIAGVADVIDDTKLDPAMLCLELSEGTIIHERAEVLPVLHRLKDLGVRIAMDDFGSGSSSLAHLKELPIDLVLIDRSFVKDLHVDGRDEAIVKAVVEVTKALGLQVAAVGIDHEETLEKLVHLGCSRGQGYLLSKPVRPNEFIRRFL